MHIVQRIIIPQEVKKIAIGAFYEGTGLRALTRGEGLEQIGNHAFKYCRLLEEIVIPNAVKNFNRVTFEIVRD